MSRQDALAIDIWIKNLMKPMYGQYDFTGRLISFFMRGFQIMARTLVLILWAAVVLIWLAVWLLIPVTVVYIIFTQIRNYL